MINNIIDVRRVELNATEPLSLDEAKAHLIITFTDDDDYITSLISQCRRAIENYCNISMVPKTVIFTADLYNEHELPYGPTYNQISSVELRGSPEGSGPPVYATATSGWSIDGGEFDTFIPTFGYWGSEPPVEYANQWMRPFRNQQFPFNRYRITYSAGPFTPDDLILAILNEMAFRYENRGEANEIRPTIAAQQGICPEARVLADPYVRVWQ